MANGRHTLRRTLGDELRQIKARPALAFMLVPMPLMIFVLLSAVFAPGLPRDLPVAVVDLDGSTLSRQLVRMVDGASDVSVTEQVPTLSEARQSLVARRVYAILLIPSELQRDTELGQSPEIVIFSNNQFLTAGGIAARSMGASVLTFSAGASLRMMQAGGIGPDRSMDLINPIPVQQSPLFNPSLDYIQFLLSSIMPTVMQIFICAAAVLSFSRIFQSTSAPMPAQHHDAGKFIMGKFLPYTVLAALVLLLGDLILFRFFGASFRGNVFVFLLNGLVFILACQALGALAALIAKDTARALGLVGLIVAPAFGFAGVSFPRFGMSEFSQAWGAIIPLTPYLDLRTDQTLRGTPLEFSIPAMVWLFAQLVVYATLLWIVMRKTLGSTVVDAVNPTAGASESKA